MTEPLPATFQIETLVTITERHEAIEPRRRYVIRGDEELDEYHKQSRTGPLNGSATINYKCTPSVFRFYPEPKDKLGDFRVDISPMIGYYLLLNQEHNKEEPKTRYLFNPGTALFNSTGYPMQAYTTMSGNVLEGEITGDWLRFKTFTPDSEIAALATHETFPQYVHKFDLVCWDNTQKRTYHKDTTPQGVIYYFLVSKEGYGWMPARYVKEV